VLLSQWSKIARCFGGTCVVICYSEKLGCLWTALRCNQQSHCCQNLNPPWSKGASLMNMLTYPGAEQCIQLWKCILYRCWRQESFPFVPDPERHSECVKAQKRPCYYGQGVLWSLRNNSQAIQGNFHPKLHNILSDKPMSPEIRQQ
jgi:hypothetical protein